MLDSWHATVARNNSGDDRAIYITDRDGVYSSANLRNTILSGHNIGIDGAIENRVTVDSLLWYDTQDNISALIVPRVSASNEHSGNPNFATDGYHIKSGSAAIDAGLSSAVSSDIDGDFRPVGNAPDLGADEIEPVLTINYRSGSPGSFFTIFGTNYPRNEVAEIAVKGVTLGSTNTDALGNFSTILATVDAGEGFYQIVATVNPTAAANFVLGFYEPKRLKEGSGNECAVPAGIALTSNIQLPVTR